MSYFSTSGVFQGFSSAEFYTNTLEVAVIVEHHARFRRLVTTTKTSIPRRNATLRASSTTMRSRLAHIQMNHTAIHTHSIMAPLVTAAVLIPLLRQ